MPIELTDENFEKEIQNSTKPVLVDFFASWCTPCFILTPVLEKLAEEYNGKFILAKANLEAVPLTASKFGVDRIPLVILFKDGKPASGFVGMRPEPVIREMLDKTLADNSEIDKIEELIREYREYAERNGFKLNPDRRAVERLVNGLLENEKKYGARYCPCRRVTGNKEEDKSKICPCSWHKEEIERGGRCFCGLFAK